MLTANPFRHAIPSNIKAWCGNPQPVQVFGGIWSMQTFKNLHHFPELWMSEKTCTVKRNRCLVFLLRNLGVPPSNTPMNLFQFQNWSRPILENDSGDVYSSERLKAFAFAVVAFSRTGSALYKTQVACQTWPWRKGTAPSNVSKDIKHHPQIPQIIKYHHPESFENMIQNLQTHLICFLKGRPTPTALAPQN